MQARLTLAGSRHPCRGASRQLSPARTAARARLIIAQMRVDWVRVYQRKGAVNIGCSPPGFETEAYIQSHLEAYMNPNRTDWAMSGFEFPKNNLVDTC